MGKDWTKEELKQASKAMMASGQMGYEEYCNKLADGMFDLESTELAVKPTEV